jgi:hypothetical protein
VVLYHFSLSEKYFVPGYESSKHVKRVMIDRKTIIIYPVEYFVVNI